MSDAYIHVLHNVGKKLELFKTYLQKDDLLITACY